MSRRWQLALLALGAALFALVIHRVGVRQIRVGAAQVGWLFLPILALYGVAYACSAQSWRLLMPQHRARPSFWRAYAITVSGFSLNYVTPFVNAGGEPFRAAAVAPWLGSRQAASSVIVHRMLHTLGLLLTWLTALLLALVLLPRTAPLAGGLLAVATAVAASSWLVLRGHRHGLLESGLDLLHRVPLVRRLARRVEPRRGALVEMDDDIAQSYHASRRRFFGALTLEYLARGLYMLEYWLICHGVGISLSYATAYLVGGLSSLTLNALFFIPFELGTKEGVLFLLFRLAGLDPRAGVVTAIVSRARDLIWIAAGLALLAAVRHRRALPGRPTPAPSGAVR